MLYILLSCLLLLMAIVFYRFFNREIVSPTIITCLIFFVSVLGAFLGTSEGSWNNIFNLHWNTVCYILLGVFCFGIGELLARRVKVYIHKRSVKQKNNDSGKIIHIDFLKNFIIIIFVLVTMVLLYMNLRTITGGNSLSQIISGYKSSSILYNENALEEGATINSMVLNMLRFCEITCVVYIYIIVKNLFLKDKLRNNILPAVIILLISFLSMMVGGRAILLKFFVAGFIIWSIMYIRNKHLSVRKFFKIGIKLIIVFVPICYFVLPLLGGNNSTNIIDYVSFYLGSQIPSFDIFLNNPIIKSEHFGQMTLKGIQMFLSKFGIIDYWSAYQKDWIYFTPTLYTNTFTEFKPFLQDFGIIGLIVFPIIFGFVFSKLYLAAKENSNCRYIIFFAFFASLLIDQARIEVFFNTFISTRTIIYLICMIFVTWFLFGSKPIKEGEI